MNVNWTTTTGNANVMFENSRDANIAASQRTGRFLVRSCADAVIEVYPPWTEPPGLLERLGFAIWLERELRRQHRAQKRRKRGKP